MKKFVKKSMVLFLALLMLCTVSIPAFAATLDTVKQYDSYFAIGDSVSRGCGLDGYYDDAACLKMIEGSFTYILAQSIGCKDPSQRLAMNYSGQRTVETRYCLGEDVDVSDAYDTNYFAEKFASMVSHKAEYIEACKNAGLVTIELGTNDVFFSSFALAGMSDFDFSKITAGDIAQIAATLVSSMWNGYNSFIKNFPKVIERVRELNPTCDIVLVSIYNPIENLPITDELFIPVGNAASLITYNMNSMIKGWAKEYGVGYADIEDVETPAASSEITFVSDEFLHNGAVPTHPTQAGLHYIARQIAAELPTETPVKEPIFSSNTDICIDLGSFKCVSSVMVDGKLTKNYSFKDHVLRISNNSKNKKSVTVTGQGENGKPYVYAFYVQYDRNEGYESRRVFSTNDIFKTAERVVKLVTAPLKLLGSLFSK